MRNPKGIGLIRCTNAGAVLEKHLQARLRVPFQNISPLGKPIATLCHSLHPSPYLAQGAKSRALAKQEGDVFSQSRASSLVKGFEKAAPAWLAQAPPCASALFESFAPAHLALRAAFWQSTAHLPRCLVVPIRVIRGSMLSAPNPVKQF